MKTQALIVCLGQFNEIAREGLQKLEQTRPYLIDVYLKGTAGEAPTFTGTMKEPRAGLQVVELSIDQDGMGTDYGAVIIECESIAAVRMRKPHGRAA